MINLSGLVLGGEIGQLLGLSLFLSPYASDLIPVIKLSSAHHPLRSQ